MPSHFPNALNQILVELNYSQREFAEAVGVSQGMIGKLLAGKRGRHETYKKIFRFFREDYQPRADQKRKDLALQLMEAHLRDTVDDFHIYDTEFDNTDIDVRVDRKSVSTVKHMFARLPHHINLALYQVGHKAKVNDSIQNSLMALAETSLEVEPRGACGGFPHGFFASFLSKPAGSRRLAGGSLGEIINDLTDNQE